MTNPYDQYVQQKAAPKRQTENPYDQYVQPDAPKISDTTMGDIYQGAPLGPVDLKQKPRGPLQDGRLNIGLYPTIANNLPFGEEALAGIVSGVRSGPGSVYGAVTGDEKSGKPYFDTLQNMRDEEAAYREEYPQTAFAAGTLPGLALWGGAGAGLAIPRTVAGRMAQGALAGGGVGALYGAGAGEGDIQSRAGEAGLGLAGGALLGGAVPLVATGAGNLYAAGRDAITVDPILRRLGISRDTADVVGEAYSRDNIGGGAAHQIMRAGPQGMIADAGPNSAQTLDTVMARGGDALTLGERAVTDRAAQSNRALQAEFDRRMGMPSDVGETTTALRKAAAPKTNKAYEAAYEKPIDYSHQLGQEIEGLLGQVPPEAVNYANALMRGEGVRSRQMIARHAADGETTVFETIPDVRQLDYLTRAMNKSAYRTEDKGAMGGMTELGRVDRNTASAIRSRMRKLVPEYAHALDTAAPPIRIKNALEFGFNALKRSVTRGDVRAELEDMGKQERQAVAAGIRSQLDEVMANAQSALSDPNMDIQQAKALLKSASSDAAKDKVAEVIGDQEAAHIFIQLDQAASAFHLRALTARGSQTATRLLTSKKMDARSDPGVLGTLLSGDLPKAGKRLISTATGHTPQFQLDKENLLGREIARVLTEPRGPQAQAFVTQIQRANARRLLSQQQAAQAIGTGQWIAPAAGYTTAKTKTK